MSDLHQERHSYSFQPVKAAPILILGGDIGRFCDYDRYKDLLFRFCAEYDSVILVPGNHEFYGSSRAQGLDAATRLCSEPSMGGKLHILDRNRIDVHTDITVLGCTLHSHISEGYSRLTNDFRRILEWSVEAHNEQHSKDLQWLRASLHQLRTEEPERRVVIVTHYAPVFEKVCHPDNELNDVSECFSSTAMTDLSQERALHSVSHWIFGHTHWNAKIKGRDLTLLSNQLQTDDKDLTWWQRRQLYIPFKPQARLTFKCRSRTR